MAVTRNVLRSERISSTRWGLRWHDSLAPMLVWLRLVVTFVTYVLATLAVYVVVSHGVVWGTRTWNDLRYDFPRTTQVSGVVGHSDSAVHPTHLFALNLKGQVSVWEIPGGDTSKVQVLAGPYLFGEDGEYAVPHLSLRDMDGDGQADVVVTIRGEMVVYLNREGTFRLPTAEERTVLDGER